MRSLIDKGLGGIGPRVPIASRRWRGQRVCGSVQDRALHVLLTANLAWNLAHFRRPLIEALVADGHLVTALAPPDGHVAELEAMGCRFLPLDMNSKGTSIREDLVLVGRLLGTFRRERPDVVLSFTVKNNVYAALAARPLGIPILPNVTGLGTVFIHRSAASRVAGWLYRLAFRGLPIVFFQNEEDRALFDKRSLVDRGSGRVLPGSGLNLQHFAAAPLPAGNGAVRFLLVARLLWDKGVGEFVEAAQMVALRHPEAAFELVGPLGAENRTAILPATVAGWVARGIVSYAGPAADVRPAIAAADCVVLPSYREGMPRVLMEAAAMARPVIATDVPGCRAAVEDGRTGLLCRVRDAADLAEKMLAVIAAGPAGRAAMGAAGRAKAEREYDASKVVARYRAALAEFFPAVLAKADTQLGRHAAVPSPVYEGSP